MELLIKLKEVIEQGYLDSKYIELTKNLCQNYLNAAHEGNHSYLEAQKRLNVYFHLVCDLVKNPVSFAPYHQRKIKPFDYYSFGNDFFSLIVDPTKKIVEGTDQLRKINEQVNRKENVVLLANHQCESDPQFISLLLEDHVPSLAEDMIFVAGERVVLDPLSIPFSLGRNLLCIYSKNHIGNQPELKEEKQNYNKRTMSLLSQLFQEGGKCIYVAPSGGRDRKNENDEIEVAPFDAQSIEMMYLMAKKSTVETHFYPLTLATYDRAPPPKSREKEIGESRFISFGGIGASFGEEIVMEAKENFPISKSEWRLRRAQEIHQIVKETYTTLARQL